MPIFFPPPLPATFWLQVWLESSGGTKTYVSETYSGNCSSGPGVEFSAVAGRCHPIFCHQNRWAFQLLDMGSCSEKKKKKKRNEWTPSSCALPAAKPPEPKNVQERESCVGHKFWPVMNLLKHTKVVSCLQQRPRTPKSTEVYFCLSYWLPW